MTGCLYKRVQDPPISFTRGRFNALQPKVLTVEECQRIAALYENPNAFRCCVVMGKHGFGRGEYQRRPIRSSCNSWLSAFERWDIPNGTRPISRRRDSSLGSEAIFNGAKRRTSSRGRAISLSLTSIPESVSAIWVSVAEVRSLKRRQIALLPNHTDRFRGARTRSCSSCRR